VSAGFRFAACRGVETGQVEAATVEQRVTTPMQAEATGPQVPGEHHETGAADARDLQSGFLLNEWLVEPRSLRTSHGGVTICVKATDMEVLLCLVESKGAFVDRRTLCHRVFANVHHSDQLLREAILTWHTAFGDSSRRPRYIAANGRDGYSLIARFEPVRRMPIPERLLATGMRNVSTSGTQQTIVGHAHRLLGELRRRRVFRVTASYLIGMWILLQVAEVTFAPLHFPTWWITALTILAVVGIPIIISLAWTYEITSDGVVRDSVDVAMSVRRLDSRRAVAPAIVAGVVLMAAVTGYAWWESIR
jgi:DNA-binding winged helix-turn-helix (wHTH) protein